MLSKHLKVRPSEILGEQDEWAAYCLDRAVLSFGVSLESELNGVNDKDPKRADQRRARILAKWLPESNRASTQSGFKDPAARG